MFLLQLEGCQVGDVVDSSVFGRHLIEGITSGLQVRFSNETDFKPWLQFLPKAEISSERIVL